MCLLPARRVRVPAKLDLFSLRLEQYASVEHRTQNSSSGAAGRHNLFYETVCFPGIFDCDTTNVRKSEPEFCTVQLSLRVLFQSVFEI